MKTCERCGGVGAIWEGLLSAKPCPCLTDRIKKLEKVYEAALEVRRDYEDPQFALEHLMAALEDT